MLARRILPTTHRVAAIKEGHADPTRWYSVPHAYTDSLYHKGRQTSDAAILNPCASLHIEHVLAAAGSREGIGHIGQRVCWCEAEGIVMLVNKGIGGLADFCDQVAYAIRAVDGSWKTYSTLCGAVRLR